MSKTVAECLALLGVNGDTLEDASLVEQFGMIKRSYFKKALSTHPDKGGDAEAFQKACERHATL